MPTHEKHIFEESELDSWRVYGLSPILGLLILTTIFGNLFVLYDFSKRFWKSAQRVLPTHYFIANLAMADFLVGIVVLPFLATVDITREWMFGRGWCTVWTFLHFWLCAASILSTCMVCVDRYVGVKYPFRHREIFSQRNIGGALLVLWTVAGVPASLKAFAWTRPTRERDWRMCDLRQEVWAAIFGAMIVLYIPLAVMAVLYMKIFSIASKHMNKKGKAGTHVELGKSDTNESSTSSEILQLGSAEINKNGDDPDSVTKKVEVEKRPVKLKDQLTSEERQIRLAKRLFFLVAVLVVSYFPYFTLILVRSVELDYVNIHVFRVFAWLRYFNSCLNPFIYAYAVPDYRKSLRRSVSRVTRKWSTLPANSNSH